MMYRYEVRDEQFRLVGWIDTTHRHLVAGDRVNFQREAPGSLPGEDIRQKKVEVVSLDAILGARGQWRGVAFKAPPGVDLSTLHRFTPA